MGKKSAIDIKKLYVDFIKTAPDELTVGDIDILFINLYLYVKGTILRAELIASMKYQVISGLAMAYLLEEIENKKKSLARHTLPAEYGLQ